MKMGIDQPGDNGTSLKIDDARLRAGKLSNIGGFAQGHDLRLLDGDSLLNRESVINCRDLPVDEDQINLRPRRHCREQSRNRNDQSAHH